MYIYFKQYNKKTNTAQYRRELIKSALKAPLTYCQNVEPSELELDKPIKAEKEYYLFNIYPSASKSFRSSSLDLYVTEEKLKILGELYFKSRRFRNFASRSLKCHQTKSIYQFGIESSTNEWLLEQFQTIAQSGNMISHSKNSMKMFKCVNMLLNKII